MHKDSTSSNEPDRHLPVGSSHSPYPYLNQAVDDEIDLRELLGVIWRGRWVILAVTVLFAIGSVAYALSLPNIYKSQVLLAPSEDAQGGGISSMAGQLGGLASLAGISLGGGTGNDKVAVAMAVLQSRNFISDFVERYDLLPELMAVDSWMPVENRLVFDPDLYLEQEEKWVRSVDFPFEPKPSSWEAYETFMEILSVSKDKETGFVTVTVEHQSPHLAAEWASWLVKDVNAVMKEKDVSEARKSIEFLQNQLSRIALAEMRTVFYQLIEEQTKTIMLAEVRNEFVFSTIDPPVVAEVRSKPKRALICILGTMIGGMLAVVIVLLRHFLRAPG